MELDFTKLNCIGKFNTAIKVHKEKIEKISNLMI